MKVIFFGLGSIGKRHLGNLQDWAEEEGKELEVHAFRSSRQSNYIQERVYNIYDEEELDNDYDVAFITNPTSLHYKTIQLIKNKAKWLFVEKPLFEENYPLRDLLEERNRFYIAAPLRYKKVMQDTKKIIAEEKVLHARIICSSYLPDWRPGDYRTSYSSYSELGGGIELDCIHEMDYATYLFGIPLRSCSMIGKVSNLEISSPDTANYLLEYSDKYIEIHVDYFGKAPQRQLEIITTENTYVADFYKNTLTNLKSGETTSHEEESNDMYRAELQYFLEEVTAGCSNENNLVHAAEILKLAKGESE